MVRSANLLANMDNNAVCLVADPFFAILHSLKTTRNHLSLLQISMRTDFRNKIVAFGALARNLLTLTRRRVGQEDLPLRAL